MTCPKCTGLLCSQWDVETRTNQTMCLICSYRPAWGKPAPPEPESLSGKYPRKGEKFTCKCGRPKVAWRSRCIHCANRHQVYHRAKAKADKARRKRAAKKAFA